MTNDFKRMLGDDLAEVDEPPMGDLVQASVAEGRRLQLRRRAGMAGVAAAVLAVALGAGGFAVAGQQAPVDQAAAPSVAVSSTAPAGKREKATPAGLLQLLTELLPQGSTSHYAGDPDYDETKSPMIQTYLDRGDGPGMIRMTATSEGTFSQPGDAKAGYVAECEARGQKNCDSIVTGIRIKTPVTLPNGVKYQVSTMADNCVSSTVVSFLYPNGEGTDMYLSTCLGWDGAQNQRTEAVLTVQEAVAIGGDLRWGATIDPKLNEAGAKKFPRLSTDFSQR